MRHKAVGKDSGKTNHIERFNNTMRQRIPRLVRKTLSLSKNLENTIGSIWYFIHHYNAAIHKLRSLSLHTYHYLSICPNSSNSSRIFAYGTCA